MSSRLVRRGSDSRHKKSPFRLERGHVESSKSFQEHIAEVELEARRQLNSDRKMRYNGLGHVSYDALVSASELSQRGITTNVPVYYQIKQTNRKNGGNYKARHRDSF